MAKSRNVYRGGTRARDFDLFKGSQIQPWMIGPQMIRATAVSDAQLRAEYSRLRSIANKRIQRMEGKPEAQETFSQHAGGFPKVAGMNRSDLVYALDDVTRFLTAERGSLSGIRYSNKKIQKTLSSRGISVPRDQLAKFGSFMNAMKKALGVNRGDYASQQIAELWSELFQKGKISQKKFEKRVKEVMREIEEEQKQLYKRAQRSAVNEVLRENPVSDFFDDVALDPRTVRAAKTDRNARASDTRSESWKAGRRARQNKSFRRRH